MKSTLLLSLVVWLASVTAAAQNAQSLPSAPSPQNTQKQTLPSAPSATLPRPATPPAQPASQPAPAQAQPQQPPATANTQPAATPKQQKAPAPQAAKADPPNTDQPVTVIKTNVDEVSLVFTVTDKHGRFVKDLKKDDFKLLDDNKPPMQIKDFRSETDLPLRVGLLIDASNSIRDRFKFEQEAATEFLNDIIRRKYDKAFVIGFDTTPEVTQDFTDNSEELSRGIHLLRPGGGTALYDAVYFACRDKLKNSGGGGTGTVRKAIILLSDGDDNQSRVTREEAIEMAQRAEVIIYTISTNISGVVERGDKTLQRIAEATGGRYFAPFKLQDVANAFSDIQQELRSQYAMAYKPADFRADGRFRAIDISAENRKGLHVRARKGYYAPRQ